MRMRTETKLRLANMLMQWVAVIACLTAVWYNLQYEFPQLTDKQVWAVFSIVILCYVRPGFPEASRA